MGALEWSLDVATAVSIIGAAAVFILEQRRQKHADREDAKWALFRELADKLAEFKNQIVQEVLVVNSSLVNKIGSADERNKKVESLRIIARTALSSAYYYANYDLRLKAEAIARHYDDPGLKHIPDKIESFLASMSDVLDRINLSERVTAKVKTSVKDYYQNHFLLDLGLRLRDDPPDFEQPHGEDLDKDAKDFEEYNRTKSKEFHYMPRRYIKKGDLPPTAFEVLDGFFESILGKS